MDNDIDTIEEVFDQIPEEVQHYVYSKEFNESLTALCSEIALNADGQTELKGALFEFISQAGDQDDLLEAVRDIVPNVSGQQKVLAWIDTNVTQKILALLDQQITLDSYEEQDEIESAQTSATSTPATATPASTASLSTLAERLKQASIATPARSEYTDTPQNPPSAPNEPSGSIDPYREPVDNV